MDISSGAGYPASSLSNFAPHEFEIDGVKCASMEGFLQSLKFQNPEMQKYVCSLVGKAAKFKGKSKKWQKNRENDNKTLLKAYSKQITKLKDIINRVKDDNKLPDDVKKATLDFISDIATIFEYRKIGLAAKLSIELTLKKGSHEPHDCTAKIKPNNTFTDEYYGFYISSLTAEYMVKAYKITHGTKRNTDWSVADIMVNCLDVQEVNFAAYNEIFIDFINDLERFECDGFIIQVTKDKAEKINEDELIATCKTHYGFYLPTDFDYKNNIVLFRGRYSV